ncbi:MAG: isopentenyl phosphate kinase [Candidatus Moraniibacteriota bacterium]
MRHRPLFIVKLGGSIITHKNREFPSIRKVNIVRIGKALVKNFDLKKYRLILVHGAGSFGHLSAKKFDLAQGTKDHPEKLFRALENQALDQELNTQMVKILQTTALPVTGIKTSSVVTNKEGELSSFEMKALLAALDTNTIPLLYGDMVFDTSWGMSICSGDVLTPFLAEKLKATKIFYASDVDGIFTRDPFQYRDAKLIREISLSGLLSGKISLSRSHNIDVTAGFKGKFEIYKKRVFPSLQAIHVFNGLKSENFNFISRKSTRVPGTIIDAKK